MQYYGNDNEVQEFLAHYGVVGMHWGIRRYQPYSVKPRGSGKLGKLIGEAARKGKAAKSKVDTVVKKYKRRQNLKKARAAKAAKAAEEAEKERIIRSGSANEVYRNRDKLSTKDISDAITRIQKENTLKSLMDEETKKKSEKTQQFMKKMVDYGKTAVSLYDTGKDIQKRIDEARGPSETQKQIKDAIASGDHDKIIKFYGKMSAEQKKEAATSIKQLDAIMASKAAKEAKNTQAGNTSKEADFVEQFKKKLEKDVEDATRREIDEKWERLKYKSK